MGHEMQECKTRKAKVSTRFGFINISNICRQKPFKTNHEVTKICAAECGLGFSERSTALESCFFLIKAQQVQIRENLGVLFEGGKINSRRSIYTKKTLTSAIISYWLSASFTSTIFSWVEFKIFANATYSF